MKQISRDKRTHQNTTAHKKQFPTYIILELLKRNIDTSL